MTNDKYEKAKMQANRVPALGKALKGLKKDNVHLTSKNELADTQLNELQKMTAFHSECVIEKENQIKDQNKNIREMDSSIEYLQSLLLDDNTVQLYGPISQ